MHAASKKNARKNPTGLHCFIVNQVYLPAINYFPLCDREEQSPPEFCDREAASASVISALRPVALYFSAGPGARSPFSASRVFSLSSSAFASDNSRFFAASASS